MAKVIVPRLQKIQPTSGLPGSSRIRLNVPDSAASITGRTQALASLGKQGIDVFRQEENRKIDTMSSEAEQEYNVWNTEQLIKLKAHKGDPTDVYTA